MKYFQLPLLASLTALGFLFCLEATNFGCLNHQGAFVDWWVIYKEFNGERYVYLDSQMDGTPLGLSDDRLITAKNSPITRTVNSAGFPNIKESAHSPCYLAWNDQPNLNENIPSTFAHAKVRWLFSKDFYIF